MIVHRSPLPDVDIPEVPITEYVLRFADELADKAAIIEGPTGKVVTFSQLAADIHGFAGGLASRGFGPGQTLAIMAPNLPEYAVAFHGVAVAGGCLTPVNPAYGAAEVRHQLTDSSARYLVTVPDAVETARLAIEGTDVTELIVIGGHAGATNFADIVASDPIEQVPVDLHEDTMVMPYSSGTTGLPKGVMLTHWNLVANIVETDPSFEYRPDAVGLAALPFFHIYGMQVLMNGLVSNGLTAVTMPRFDLASSLDLVAKHSITHYFAVPPIVLALAKQPIVDEYDLSSLDYILCGAAPLGHDLAEQASLRVGCRVYQGYGMTELAGASHITPPDQYRPQSVGVTLPNLLSRIVDIETGEDQDVDGVGELWLKGPMVMKGYLNNPEATAETLDADGWLHTGDVAMIDEHDHVYIVDRVKELIKYKAFQVAPAELEAVLIAHPKIADAAVIGVPDEEAGELPKALVTPLPGAELTAEEVKEFVNAQLATYKHIRIVEFVAEIPKSASGKILRRLLRDQSG
jgi:acyl-CoA synthetase (AMP-forming)/AMP-acid ligase II